MISLRNINPMVRSVGTMGAVAAVVGGITFAGLTSNTVALSPNTLSSATAALQISSRTGDACGDFSSDTVAGFTDVKLTPGVVSDPVDFCLKNNGDVPLDLTTAIPQAALVSSPISPADVTLDITCDNTGHANGTLNEYTGGTPLGSLDAGDTTNCSATAELSSSFSGPGTTVNSFDIDFVGTQSASV
ncbi:MAG TPA: hypothetical protein VLE99_04810 [Candidatus Saccharimonadales bacterium]|nr:hypothetical protein [Candidatus Saccharimonadales bacterium]